jgi:hypothetical protein
MGPNLPGGHRRVPSCAAMPARRRPPGVALLVGLLVLVSAAGVAHAGSVPRDRRLSFTVTRDGASIGRHDMTFRRRGDRVVVKTDTKIEVQVLSITLYRFEQHRTEIREGEHLVYYDSWTDNDGEILKAHAELHGAQLEVTGTEGAGVVDGSLIPATYWDFSTTRRTRLIEGSDGRILEVSVTPVATETIELGQRAVKARHFQLRGDLERDLWYDEDGVWRRMSFRVGDGSTITYEPRP